ncbi:hypothetical protein, partial [Burkholderia gladioli]|uniref:hypothetical protein n=1 Tax=Burkholderia gladioli TaxID=28095 RepID=UPI003F7ACE5B
RAFLCLAHYVVINLTTIVIIALSRFRGTVIQTHLISALVADCLRDRHDKRAFRSSGHGWPQPKCVVASLNNVRIQQGDIKHVTLCSDSRWMIRIG